MIVVWQRGDLTGEIEAAYSGDGVLDPDSVRLYIVSTGPRGGRYTLWSGHVTDARQMIMDLRSLIDGAERAPKVARWARGQDE